MSGQEQAVEDVVVVCYLKCASCHSRRGHPSQCVTGDQGHEPVSLSGLLGHQTPPGRWWGCGTPWLEHRAAGAGRGHRFGPTAGFNQTPKRQLQAQPSGITSGEVGLWRAVAQHTPLRSPFGCFIFSHFPFILARIQLYNDDETLMDRPSHMFLVLRDTGCLLLDYFIQIILYEHVLVHSTPM